MRSIDGTIGIYDSDSAYGKMLASYINNEKTIGGTAVAFENMEMIRSFCRKNRITTLFVGEGKIQEVLEENDEKLFSDVRMIVLREDELEDTDQAEKNRQYGFYENAFKYQPVSKLLKKLCTSQSESKEVQKNVYVFYSACSAADAEKKAREKAGELSEDGKTLFILWDLFSCYTEDMDELTSLGDLLFLIRNNSPKIKDALHDLKKEDGYAAFSESVNYRDFWECEKEEPEKLISVCKELGGYEYVVISIGFFSEVTEQIMSCCEKICLVKTDDRYGEVREQSFLTHMKKAGKSDILEKIVFLDGRENSLEEM